MRMTSSKFQPPISRKIPTSYHQNRLTMPYATTQRECIARTLGCALHSHCSFRIRVSLMFGCWCPVLSASAQYSIDWHKIAGGGGTSTNGQFSLSGSIGQHDAGPAMTNGQFSVTGGFWLLPQAVQVEGAPILTITRAAIGLAAISWTP